MKELNRCPIYIAVLLENGNKKTWLPLPATKQQFNKAIGKICGASPGITECRQLSVSDYAVNAPGLNAIRLIRTPLAVVNHLAARFKDLTEENIIKLCAIYDAEFSYFSAEWLIEYTYQLDSYTLLPHICENDPDYIAGKAKSTPRGYIIAKNGWDNKVKDYPVPASLNLKGFIGEDLYGDWNHESIH